MANRKSNDTKGRKPTKPSLNYYYLNDELHRIKYVDRPRNLVVAFNYTKKVYVEYLWSDIQRRAQRTYTTKQVAAMVGRFWTVIAKHVREGRIPAPATAYPPEVGPHPRSPWRWSEKDIMRLHDVMLTRHYGRPRNDGRTVVRPMPSKAELSAMLRNESITYVKTQDGEFQPVWKEIDW